MAAAAYAPVIIVRQLSLIATVINHARAACGSDGAAGRTGHGDRRTHSFSVWSEQPIFAAIDFNAIHRDGWSFS